MFPGKIFFSIHKLSETDDGLFVASTLSGSGGLIGKKAAILKWDSGRLLLFQFSRPKREKRGAATDIAHRSKALRQLSLVP